jgi:hypothetical protein
MTTRPTSTHCYRGHLRTEKSTRWYTPAARPDKRYPICRRCEAIVRNAKYAADPVFREKNRAVARAWWRAHRAQAEERV